MIKPVCVICDRELGSDKLISKHHLIPKSRGGKNTETIIIHNICHQKIHSVFSEKELKQVYHTVEKIRTNEEMIKFIKWIAKKDIDYYQKNKKVNRK